MKIFCTVKNTSRRARRSGSVMIEFALVLPILIVLTMGLIQYGLISNATSTLTNLTREGARYGALHATAATTTFQGVDQPTDNAIRKYIQYAASPTSIRSADLPDANITISPAPGDAARVSGSPLTITVSYDMRKKFFLPADFPGLSKFGTSYTTNCVMIIE